MTFVPRGLIVVIAAALLVLPGMAGISSPAVDVTAVQTGDRITLNYSFGDFRSRSVAIDGAEYIEPLFQSEPVVMEVGAPALPYICRSVIIPDDVAMSVEVLGADYYEVALPIAPSKGTLPRTIDPADVSYTFGHAYEQDAFYPGQLAELGDPYIMRDVRGVTVRVYPFQYNPVKGVLRVYTSMTLDVTPTGFSQVNALDPSRERKAPSRAFNDVYANHFLNYDAAARYAPMDEEGDMLIICYDAWLPNIQPLVDHKNSIGINTTAVGISTIGNTSTAIKNYIQNVYNTSDLAFVLLVGDLAQVTSPTTMGGSGNSGPGDPTYGKLAGSDSYPDIMVGRFSASSPADVDTQVTRTIEYENTPATQAVWFWKGTGIGSSQGAGIGDEGQADYVHIGEIRGWLMGHGYTQVDELYDPGATASQVVSALNQGRGVLNYCGHGYEFGITTTGFDTGDLNVLTNDNMLPFMFIVACEPGSIDENDCFGEVALQATNNGEPTGAIAAYVSSTLHAWAEPMEAQDEFNLLLTNAAEPCVCMGAMCFAGSCSMIDDYPSVGALTYDTWLLLGDPSLRVVGTVQPASGMRVQPTTNFVSEGPNGGPFTPAYANYTLENFNATPLNYQVTVNEPWLTVSSSSGSIPAESSITVTVSYSAAAGALGNGLYTDTVTFANMDDHEGDAVAGVQLTVGVPEPQYVWDLDSDPGWTITGGEWAFGQPAGLGGDSYGSPDPASGATGYYVYGVNLGGDYSLTPAGPYYIVAGPVSLVGMDDVTLRYKRFLNSDYRPYAYAMVQVSSDGTNWEDLWANSGQVIDDENWTGQILTVPSNYWNQDTLYIRWGYQVGSYAFAYSGWNIDDVEIWALGETPSNPIGDLNCDGVLDLFDVDPFVAALTSANDDPPFEGYNTAYPGCDPTLADMNDDGVVDLFDIQGFVDALTG